MFLQPPKKQKGQQKQKWFRFFASKFKTKEIEFLLQVNNGYFLRYLYAYFSQFSFLIACCPLEVSPVLCMRRNIREICEDGCQFWSGDEISCSKGVPEEMVKISPGNAKGVPGEMVEISPSSIFLERLLVWEKSSGHVVLRG